MSRVKNNFTGKLFLLIGPSGVGKGTLIDILKKKHKDEWVFPVSVTTRKMREGEKDGKTYYFYSKEKFKKKRDMGEFLEWACVHGKNYYGLLKKTVFKALEEGKIVFREIDIQGFENISKILPRENLISIFLLPPSIKLLEKRIRSRSPLTDEEVARRIKSAKKEIKSSKECTYRIQTEDMQIDKSIQDIEKIIQDELNS